MYYGYIFPDFSKEKTQSLAFLEIKRKNCIHLTNFCVLHPSNEKKNRTILSTTFWNFILGILNERTSKNSIGQSFQENVSDKHGMHAPLVAIYSFVLSYTVQKTMQQFWAWQRSQPMKNGHN